MRVFDPEEEQRFNLCVFGEPGCGKTRLAATACMNDTMGKVLWLNVEGGMITLKDMDLTNLPLVEDIDKVSELEDIYNSLKKSKSEFKDIHTVVIDNGTDLVPIDLEAVVERVASEEIAKHGKTRRSGRDDVWLNDRGETGRRLGRIFRWYRDLDVNVIITAHPRFEYKKKADGTLGELTDVRTEFPPALRRQVEGYQDFVWYIHHDDKSGDRRMLTQRRGVYFAKTRGERFQRTIGDVLALPIDKPILPDLFTALQTGELDSAYHKGG